MCKKNIKNLQEKHLNNFWNYVDQFSFRNCPNANFEAMFISKLIILSISNKVKCVCTVHPTFPPSSTCYEMVAHNFVGMSNYAQLFARGLGFQPGSRIWNFLYGSTWKCNRTYNVKVENLWPRILIK